MMRFGKTCLAAAAAFSLVAGGTAAARQLTAPGSASAQNEVQGAATGLGSSHRFPSVAAAQAHCGSDTVVWSDGVHLTYVLPGAPQYGTTKYGFYACKSEADSGGFSQAGQ